LVLPHILHRVVCVAREPVGGAVPAVGFRLSFFLSSFFFLLSSFFFLLSSFFFLLFFFIFFFIFFLSVQTNQCMMRTCTCGGGRQAGHRADFRVLSYFLLNAVLFFSMFFFPLLEPLGEPGSLHRGLRSRQASDDDAEGRARDVIQAALGEEVDAARVPTVFPAHANLQHLLLLPRGGDGGGVGPLAVVCP
jgi:hypothetical protein